ncbi:MAG TPA: cytochrome c biogenesis CcdA family protein [Sphingorhabdus sp.]|nr:cytochrome c biogenesis CcdA family protein [Sphingorhabdus sp.]
MSGSLNPLLAYAAGMLTILSPCVLPLVPIVLASAGQAHRWGPFALAAGLVVSFTGIGFLVATAGVSSGIDGDAFRMLGAVLLVAAGLLLLVPQAQSWLTRVATPLADWANARQARMERFGLAGQAGIGVLLGLVWSPCIGPTLGAATVLAAQGTDLGGVALVMAAFGLGIATVLVALALVTRGLLQRWRGRLMQAGGRGKVVLGGVLMVVGLLVFTGGDKLIESAIIAASPDWLIEASTAV